MQTDQPVQPDLATMTDIFGIQLLVGDYVWFLGGRSDGFALGPIRKFSTYTHKYTGVVSYKVHLTDLRSDTAVCLEEQTRWSNRLRKACDEEVEAYLLFQGKK